MTSDAKTAPDAPEVAAAIAARKRVLDTQTVMAIVGLLAVAAFLVFKPGDWPGTTAAFLTILPWLFGLSVAIFALNRWVLSIQIRQLRRKPG